MTEAHVLAPGDRIIIGGQPVTVTAIHQRVDDLLVHLPGCLGGHPAVAIDWEGDEILPNGMRRLIGRSVRRCSAEVEAVDDPASVRMRDLALDRLTRGCGQARGERP